jgi:hypothetical protein
MFQRSGQRLYLSLQAVLKEVVPERLKPILKRADPVHLAWNREDPPEFPLQQNRNKNGLDRYGYSLFSQNGEDGIIRYLFSRVGFSSRRFLEFGFGSTENNSLRLVLKEGFGGVFIDGSETSVAQFNRAARSFGICDVKAINAFLTVANLEDTVRIAGVPEDIDLLSIDVDGNDYWFWDALSCVSPRVVIVEYNASFGPERSLTVPYDSDFDRMKKHPSGFHHGASLVALDRLGQKKGYGLVGCDGSGVNAFFVRNDCITNGLEVVTPREAYRPHKRRLERGFSLEAQFAAVQSLPYVEIP